MVARALAEAGFAAWTPVEVQRRRVPRSKKIHEVQAALTPSLAFADYARLPELGPARPPEAVDIDYVKIFGSDRERAHAAKRRARWRPPRFG